jgi:4-carboxymuconolactone decarboxylase
MTAADLALVKLSAAIALGDEAKLTAALDAAIAAADPTAVEETILQAYLFIGFPAVIRAFSLLRDRTGPAPARAAGDGADRAAHGERICSIVYGGQYGRLRDNVRALHPDLEEWMVVEGYGKVLGRDGLELRTRELCVIALLAVQNAPKQLYSHLRGALNAGASTGEVEASLGAIASMMAAPRAADAARVWSEVRERRRGK